MHLQNAHDWFKTKFDHLQDEIMESRYEVVIYVQNLN